MKLVHFKSLVNLRLKVNVCCGLFNFLVLKCKCGVVLVIGNTDCCTCSTSDAYSRVLPLESWQMFGQDGIQISVEYCFDLQSNKVSAV